MPGHFVRAAALSLSLFAAFPAQARQILKPPRTVSPEVVTPDSLGAQIVPAHLTYCGGRVLGQAQIVAVLWGAPDTPRSSASCSGSFATCLTSWYTAFVQSPQFDWLDEYQTTLAASDGSPGTNQHILQPSFYGVVQIAPANTGKIVGEIEVEAEIVAQIQAGHLPAPDAAAETIYEVHFPLGVDPSDNGNQACSDFCAYHDSWQSNILGKTGIIAILPSHMPPGYSGGRDCAHCGEKSDWFANLGGSISHESIEAITDPDVGSAGNDCAAPLGWMDLDGSDALSVHGEIGDMCEGIPSLSGSQQITEVTLTDANGHGYTVQREWSNAHSACVTSAADAFSIAGPSSLLIDVGAAQTATITSTPPSDSSAQLPVKLSAVGVPAGSATVTFSPATINAGEKPTMTVTLVDGATVTGFGIGIVGESGTSQAQAVVAIAAPDFATTLSGSSLALTAGGAAATLNLGTSLVTGDPRGFTVKSSGIAGVSVAAASGNLGDSITLSFTAAAGTPTTSAALIVHVISGGIDHALPVQTTVAGDEATLSAPAGLTVQQGGSAKFTVQSSTAAGNAQSLLLSATGLPDGAAVSFDPPSITSGQSAVATITASGAVPTLLLSFTLSGKGPVALFSTRVPLLVTAPDGCASPGLAPWALVGLLALGLHRRRRRIA